MTGVTQGEKFGRWTVLVDQARARGKVWCRCACGKERAVEVNSLLYSASRSCGCAKGKKAKDRRGDRFGLWTVTGELSQRKIPCKCGCGTERLVALSNLLSGASTSCGCDRNDKTGERFHKHGTGYENYRYNTWQSIKGRCLCETNKNWRQYGGRGITLYPLWIDDYPAFARYLDEHLGPRPDGFSIDRIDNEGNYEPGNIHWADKSTQARNRGGRSFYLPVDAPIPYWPT